MTRIKFNAVSDIQGDDNSRRNLFLSMTRNRSSFQENEKGLIESKFRGCASLSNEEQEVCADYIIKDGKHIGSGEYSDAYLVNGLVVKKNRDRSKYNPPQDPANYDPSRFLKISKREMESEVRIYKTAVEKGFGKVLPKFMLGFDLSGRYYIIREYGLIYLQPGQNEWVSYPKWQTGKISQETFNGFCEVIFLVGKELEGTWFDSLQIGLRETGEVFLMDLGHFFHKDEWETRITDDDFKQEEIYERIIMNIQRLGEQLSLVAFCPTFIADFYIRFYTQRKEESHLGTYYEKKIEEWKEIKKTKVLLPS